MGEYLSFPKIPTKKPVQAGKLVSIDMYKKAQPLGESFTEMRG
jgi:hypothetical protein